MMLILEYEIKLFWNWLITLEGLNSYAQRAVLFTFESFATLP